MAKLEISCPKCGRNARTVKTKKSPLMGGSLVITLTCGHVIIEKDSKDKNLAERDDVWNQLFPFQKEGVEFAERANFRCLIADEMGLGKTVQALALLRYHPELLPALYVVKSATKYQWQVQIGKWLKKDEDMFNNVSQVLFTGNSTILPLPHTIISMDMLEKHKEAIIARGFKTIVVDESQNFKTLDSSRTSALFEIIREIDPIGVLCLTGTPVLNRASELFTTLNLIRPTQWRTYEGFINNWCSGNIRGTGIGGIKSWRQEEFQAITAPYIIRREKREVMKDLPPFRRNYEWVEIEDERIKDAYNQQLKELSKHLDIMATLKEESQGQMALLGYLEKLRQIAAIAKIPATLEYLESFLTLEEDAKIIVGLHHNIAIECLSEALAGWKPIIIDGRDSAQRKFDKVELFQKDPSRRITLASILAAGEGMDGLQHVCSNMLTLERMWNLGKERQFEARIDRYGQKEPVTNTFLLAKGTVDEYFTEIVLEKEQYVVSTTTSSREEVHEKMEKHYSGLNYVDLARKCVNNKI